MQVFLLRKNRRGNTSAMLHEFGSKIDGRKLEPCLWTMGELSQDVDDLLYGEAGSQRLRDGWRAGQLQFSRRVQHTGTQKEALR